MTNDIPREQKFIENYFTLHLHTICSLSIVKIFRGIGIRRLGRELIFNVLPISLHAFRDIFQRWKI